MPSEYYLILDAPIMIIAITAEYYTTHTQVEKHHSFQSYSSSCVWTDTVLEGVYVEADGIGIDAVLPHSALKHNL